MFLFFFQAEDGIRDWSVTGVQTCALPIWRQEREIGPMEEAAARRAVIRARRMELVRRPERTPPFGARRARTCRIPGDHSSRRVIEIAQVHTERRIRTGRDGAFTESREERETGEDD